DRSPPEAALSAVRASSAGNARASAAVVSVREVGASAPVPEWQAASAANSRRDAAIRSNGRERDITDLGIWPRNRSAREGGATYGPRRRRPSSSSSTRGPWARTRGSCVARTTVPAPATDERRQWKDEPRRRAEASVRAHAILVLRRKLNVEDLRQYAGGAHHAVRRTARRRSIGESSASSGTRARSSSAP